MWVTFDQVIVIGICLYMLGVMTTLIYQWLIRYRWKK